MHIKLFGSMQYQPGYFYGLRHASLHLNLEIDNAISIQKLNPLNLSLQTFFKSDTYALNSKTTQSAVPVLQFLLHWIYTISKNSGMPVFEAGKIQQIRDRQYKLMIPCIEPKNASLLLQITQKLLQLCNEYSQNPTTEIVDQVFGQIKATPHSGTNVPRFYQAAYQLGIPFAHIATNVQQYGYGSKHRLLDSSFTDQTSNMGSRIARNKHLCSSFLHQAGIPVAKQIKVSSEKGALDAALKIEYPVVVKPANLDGGIGVYAGLRSPKDLSRVFNDVLKHTKEILIEKHIAGRDYRINIFEGKVLWAIERVPAGITGDGKHTVKELVQLANKDHRRGEKNTQTLLKNLKLDNEALDLLGEKGYQLQSILENGTFVPLRRKANISAGGMPVSVMDKIHPDNSLLAIRTAKLLNLDLAGIDIITSDISKSWRENGGVICEVNGQPQLGGVTSSHNYGEVLQQLLQGNGRIPIVLLFGSENDVTQKTVSYFTKKGLTVGSVSPRGVFIGTKCINNESTLYSGGRMLLIDKSVDMIVISINDLKVLKTGLPFDRYDLLVLAGKEITMPSDIDSSSKQRILKKTINVLLTACTRGVINTTNNREVLLNYKKVINVKKENLIKTIDKVFTSR